MQRTWLSRGLDALMFGEFTSNHRALRWLRWLLLGALCTVVACSSPRAQSPASPYAPRKQAPVDRAASTGQASPTSPSGPTAPQVRTPEARSRTLPLVQQDGLRRQVLWAGPEVSAWLRSHAQQITDLMVVTAREVVRRVEAMSTRDNGAESVLDDRVLVAPDAAHWFSVNTLVVSQGPASAYLSFDAQGRMRVEQSFDPQKKARTRQLMLDGTVVYRAERIGWVEYAPRAVALGCIAKREGTWRVWVRGQEIDQGGPFIELRLSPDAQFWGYARRAGDGWDVIHSGKVVGRGFASVQHLSLSPGGAHIGFAGKVGEKWHVVRDGRVLVTEDEVFGIYMVGEEDARMYWLARGPDGGVVKGEGLRFGPFSLLDEVLGQRVRVAPSRWAVLANKEGKKHEGEVFIDGVRKASFDPILALFGSFAAFSGDGRVVAYQEQAQDGWYVVFGSDRWGPSVGPFWGLVISPDGSKVAGTDNKTVWVNGKEMGPKVFYVVPDSLHFLDNTTLAFAAFEIGPPTTLSAFRIEVEPGRRTERSESRGSILPPAPGAPDAMTLAQRLQ